jgi:hypothetical protein
MENKSAVLEEGMVSLADRQAEEQHHMFIVGATEELLRQ